MFERIKALKQRWQDTREIDNLSDRDLDDLGMSRAQVMAFINMPADVPDRVAHMAAIFGLSPEDIARDHDAYVELLATCGTCRDRAHCSRMLAAADRATPADCGFCLNAEAFAAQAHQPAA